MAQVVNRNPVEMSDMAFAIRQQMIDMSEETFGNLALDRSRVLMFNALSQAMADDGAEV